MVVDAGGRKGDIYEGLLAKSAAESPKGAGQYFTPRQLIKAIVDCVRPKPDDTVCDPACGTGGFLLAASDFVINTHGKELDPDQKKHLKKGFVQGWELVPNTARLCVMNLYLHGIDADPCPVRSGVDSLASHPGQHFSLVLTNPPFGKKSSIAIVNEEGDLEKEDTAYERQDFRTTTKNKQLNFLQDVKSLLKINGRCAIVVPDNVLFEGGAGETVRRNLLKQCDVHTLLRLSYRSESIVLAVSRMNRQYFLPAIQRQFVWKTDQSLGLKTGVGRALGVAIAGTPRIGGGGANGR